jgi:hypothetical protein
LLVLTMVVLCDGRIRALCASALTLIAGVIGPVAILLQGQAWRWMWVPNLVSLLLVVPTTSPMWRSGRCGPLCAVLLLPATGGVYWVAAALCLWAGRRHVPESAGPCLRFSALAMGALVIGWTLVHGWPTLTSSLAASEGDDKSPQLARRIMCLDGVPVILAYLVFTQSRAADRSPCRA